jgi:hypothetical protein
MAGVHVDGLDELRRELRRVKDRELDDEMKAIHKALAADVVKLAEPNIPVRTGALKASLRAAGTVRDAIGRVGKASVPYAPIVHWKYGPPFLTDAAGRLEQDIQDRYDREVAQMLDKVIGR